MDSVLPIFLGTFAPDGSCSIFVLLDHPISRKTWVRIPTKEVTCAMKKDIEWRATSFRGGRQ